MHFSIFNCHSNASQKGLHLRPSFTRKESIWRQLLDRNFPSRFAKIESAAAGKIRGAFFVTRLCELRASVWEWSNAGGIDCRRKEKRRTQCRKGTKHFGKVSVVLSFPFQQWHKRRYCVLSVVIHLSLWWSSNRRRPSVLDFVKKWLFSNFFEFAVISFTSWNPSVKVLFTLTLIREC